MDHNHEHSHDPPSPTFADSAIDMDLDHDHNSNNSNIHLAERLAHLARRTQGNKNTNRLSRDETVVLRRCLETIEKTVLVDGAEDDGENEDNEGDNEGDNEDDPRPNLTHEIAKSRPRSPSLNTSGTSDFTTKTAPSHSSFTIENNSNIHNNNTNPRIAQNITTTTHSQLSALLDEVTSLSSELYDRRNESFRIYDLFILKCQGLEGRIEGLDDEVRELNTDILSTSIEREGLRGTITALENWVDNWKREHEQALLEINNTTRDREAHKRWTKPKSNPENERRLIQAEEDIEALVDGITAWMRGWRDVEEGFWGRELEREERRGERRRLNAHFNGNGSGPGDEDLPFPFLMQSQNQSQNQGQG